MIELSNLTFSYEAKRALGPLSLSIEAGTSCAIIGTSGCGKTTLLRLLAGLLKPNSGTLLIDGTLLTKPRSHTGVILQHLGLLPWKTVYEQVALGLIHQGLGKSEVHEKVLELLNTLNLADHLNKYPHELSGGQKQRTAIARTLISNPDLLLLDEATSALDELTKEKLQHLILKLYKSHPITLVLVTHSIEEAVFLGQKIVVMEDGYITHIVDNPLFGNLHAREEVSFYEQVMAVRKLLGQEVSNENF